MSEPNLAQAQKTVTPTFTPMRGGLFRRKCACGQHTVAGGGCAECRKKRQSLQRQATQQAEPASAPPIVHEVLRSPGWPLDSAMRALMEPRFGYDFSQVRVHTDAKAADSARAVNALAYTVGKDVVFGFGQYAPDTAAGRRLVAHELTHVVQQSSSSTSGVTQIATANSPGEREAAQAAESAQAVNAVAYTVGQDVAFGTGQFAPGTTLGQHLFAHELAHILEQNSHHALPTAAGLAISHPNDASELQAESLAQDDVASRYPRADSLRPRHPARSLQIARQVSGARRNRTVSTTKPAYNVDDLKRRLSRFNLGPIRGVDVVNALNKDNWRILFWGQAGKIGQTFPDKKLILLPQEASLMANVSTLFHEGMHVTRMVPGSAGSVTDPAAVWANLEEEIMAQYQELLFLKAHAATAPDLVKASNYGDDWQRIEKMNKGEIYRYFLDEQVPWTIFGHLVEYRHVLATFRNDIAKMASSPRVRSILNRVILGWGPTAKPPKPERPTFPPLIRPRKDFRREILDSVRSL